MSTDRQRPNRLGRGLAALMSDFQSDRDDGAIRILPITRLGPGGSQPRQSIADDELEDLAASVRAHGVLQPLVVRANAGDPDRFEIIAGERRWRAAQLAGLHDIPAIVRSLSDEDALAIALIENLQRVDLNALEEAEGFRRLVDEHGFTQDRLSRSVGKSRSHVANTLRLLGLPVGVQSEIRRGALSAGHGRALLGHADPGAAARQVIARGLNVRQTEALNRDPGAARRAPARRRDADLAGIERDITAHLGLACQIAFDGRRGQLSIRFTTSDQLDGLLRLLLPR